MIHEQAAAHVRAACTPQQTSITGEKVRSDRVQRPFLQSVGVSGRIELLEPDHTVCETIVSAAGVATVNDPPVVMETHSLLRRVQLFISKHLKTCRLPGE